MTLEALTAAHKPYTAYDPWAWLYNRSLAPQYCADKLPILEKLLLPHLPEAAKILDLCCGTGQITQQLQMNGYEVTGLDSSEEMLRYARENAPAAQFILNDARYFELPSMFDAVFSVSASFNHLMSLAALESVFHNVHTALRPKGLFLFDLRLKGSYQNRPLTGGDVQDEYAWAVGEGYDLRTEIGQFKVTIFHATDGTWHRSDLVYETKDYSWIEIQSALEKVGFVDIKIHNANGDVIPPENNQLVYFIALKP